MRVNAVQGMVEIVIIIPLSLANAHNFFFLWGHLKSLVYHTHPRTTVSLKTSVLLLHTSHITLHTS